MFTDIGKKIKALAKIIFYIDVLGALAAAKAVIASDSNNTVLGLLIIPVGVILAWLATFLLYGYGELIDKTSEIAKNTSGSIHAAPQPFIQKSPTPNLNSNHNSGKNETENSFFEIVCPDCGFVFIGDGNAKRINCPKCNSLLKVE